MKRTANVTAVLGEVLGLMLTLTWSTPASAQDVLAPMGEKIGNHVSTVLGKEPGFEREIRDIIGKARRDATAERYETPNGTVEGAAKHPWLRNGTGANPSSEGDYIVDSTLMTGGFIQPQQTWSCFEPQLVAKGFWFTPGDWGSLDIAADPALAVACKFSCPREPWDLLGLDNGYEVIQYWWPEHQVSINNYGINRLDPTQQPSGKGGSYSRASLLAAKDIPDAEMKNVLSRIYPLGGAMAGFKGPSQAQPLRGQGMWGGYASPDLEEKEFAHGARTRVAYKTADARPSSPNGWKLEEKSVFDSFPPPTSQKDVLNLWTEYRTADAFTSISQLSYHAGSRGREAMNALFGPEINLSLAARSAPTWLASGAMPFRAGRWSDFGPLKKVLPLEEGGGNGILREVTYKGGYELFPLTMNASGAGGPVLSANAIIARRAFYVMGSRDLLRLHPDGERGRMNEYTVNLADRGTEVDKMQLLWPRVNGGVSECFRSQRIPNVLEGTTDPWVQANLPPDLVGYVDKHFGDVTYAFWNKRIACTCRFEGIPTGAWTMNDGDKPYDIITPSLCTYQKTFLPSAFTGDDQPSCLVNRDFGYYKGIDDHV